jgi:hypothetical protein
MRVHTANADPKDMQIAEVSVCVHTDDEGKPLVTAGDLVVGRVEDLLRWLLQVPGAEAVVASSGLGGVTEDRVRSLIRERGTKWR